MTILATPSARLLPSCCSSPESSDAEGQTIFMALQSCCSLAYCRSQQTGKPACIRRVRNTPSPYDKPRSSALIVLPGAPLTSITAQDQTLRNTREPLVPPKPKLLFTATSI